MSDKVALWGTIGTWVAVLLASIALIGIVSPWLVLRAAMSERNRALNMVQDVNRDYISKGIGVTRKLRFFKRPKVPALAPSYHVEMEGAPLLLPDVHKRWIFHAMKGTSCRTGWAKMCRLVEAYHVPSNEGDGDTRIKISMRGDLEFADGNTWLPVSRYWILILGLLGRYGSRADKGLLHPPTFRRDLDEDRIIIQDSDAGSSSGSSSNSSIDSEEEEEEEEVDGLSIVSSGSVGTIHKVAAAYESRQRNTEAMIKLRKIRTIWGVTGRLRKMSTKIKGSDGNSLDSPLSFGRHNNVEIGVKRKEENLTLSDLFWLATGFLPLGKDSNEQEIVACLEDPACGAFLAIGGSDKPMGRFFRLQEVQDRPRSLYMAIEALQVSNTKILSFKEDQTLQPDELSIFTKQKGSLTPQDLKASAKWTSVTYGQHKRAGFIFSPDVEKLVFAMLSLKWDPWSYLLWKLNNDIWSAILLGTSRLLRTFLIATRNPEAQHAKLVHIASHRALRWKDHRTFRREKTEDLVSFCTILSSTITQPEVLRIAIAMLVITNNGFREKVQRLIIDTNTNAAETFIRANLVEGTVTWRNPTLDSLEPLATFEFGAQVLNMQKGGNVQTFDVMHADLIMISLWAAAKCALWTSALDSKPLLDFVNKLKRVAHIV